MRRQQVSKPRPLFEAQTYLSVVALLLWWQAGHDLPIGAGHEDCEGLLVSYAAERSGGSFHCLNWSVAMRIWDRVSLWLLATFLGPLLGSCQSVG